MSLSQAFILGIIQGATEFLPISSSGHLVLTPWLLGWQIEGQQAFIFDVLVQWGTILAVMVYFRHDLWQLLMAGSRSLRGGEAWHDPLARRAWLILVASLPVAVLGLLLKSIVKLAFSSPLAVALFLVGTAALLILSERAAKLDRSLASLQWQDAILIGLFFVNLLSPGHHIHIEQMQTQAHADTLKAHISAQESYRFTHALLQIVPSNIFDTFSKGEMLGVIFFSLVFGYCISKIEQHSSTTLYNFFHAIFHTMIRLIHLVMKFLPLGVFFLVARSFAETTPADA